MISYTVPIKPTNTSVMDLLQQTQLTPLPLFLTVEGGTAPVVVMMQLEAYEKSQRQQQQFYQLQLFHLKQWLTRVEEQWADRSTRAECVAAWQGSMTLLWEICPEPARGLCASLMLAVKRLDADRLSPPQIAAPRYCITLLQSVIPSETEIDKAYQQLSQSGLPPRVSFDQNLVQSYVDES
ncbi:MAG: hypothetical protein ACOYNY_10040 [Caldilineaceae bacterium]